MVCLAEHLSADRHFVMGGGDCRRKLRKKMPRAPSQRTTVLCDKFLEDSQHTEFPHSWTLSSRVSESSRRGRAGRDQESYYVRSYVARATKSRPS